MFHFHFESIASPGESQDPSKPYVPSYKGRVTKNSGILALPQGPPRDLLHPPPPPSTLHPTPHGQRTPSEFSLKLAKFPGKRLGVLTVQSLKGNEMLSSHQAILLVGILGGN